MTVAEMLARISSQELTEWACYYGLEPFGEDRADLRSGIISATVANVNRSEKQEALTPQAFMPKFGQEPAEEPELEEETEEPEAWRKMLQQAEILNAAFGGHDARQPKRG